MQYDYERNGNRQWSFSSAAFVTWLFYLAFYLYLHLARESASIRQTSIGGHAVQHVDLVYSRFSTYQAVLLHGPIFAKIWGWINLPYFLEVLQ